MKIFAIGLCVFLFGCARAPVVHHGDVSVAAVVPADARRHEVKAQEDFVVGVAYADNRRLPDYPPELLGRTDLPRLDLCVELSVDVLGHISSTRVIDDPVCPAPPADLAVPLKHAVDAAVLSWRYTPSYSCRIPAGVVADGTCEQSEADWVPVPILRAYRFIFRQTERGPTVESEVRSSTSQGLSSTSPQRFHGQRK